MLVPSQPKARSRHASLPWCEVVRVDSPFFLVDERHEAFCYVLAADTPPLAAGYYLALWPSGVSLTRFGPEVRFLGPHESKAAAVLLRTSALGLGIVEPAAHVSSLCRIAMNTEGENLVSALQGTIAFEECAAPQPA